MPYKIRRQQLKKAKNLGVKITPSTRKGKKLDVLRSDGEKVSIGALGYKDYYEYLDEDEDLAEERRRLYRIRHGCPDKRKGTAGFYACKLLW